MAGNHFKQRLELECRAVARLRTLYILALMGAFGCITSLPLSLPWLSLLLALVTGGAWHCWRQRCELGGVVVSLLWDAEGRWWWRQAGDERELRLRADSFLSSEMIILNFTHHETDCRHSVLLFPFSVGPAVFRRLRARLMLEGRRGFRSGSDNSGA